MAMQPPSVLPPPSKDLSKKARWGNLNMGIAKTHRLATQFVGLQLSGANLLALAVSAASIVAGTVTLAAQNYPWNWPLLLAAGVIGLGLALLIEGLTLGSLIRIRLANRLIRQRAKTIEEEISRDLALLTMPDPAQPNAHRAMRRYRQTVRIIQNEYRRKYRRATSLQRKQRRFAFPFAALGATASATAGGLFYHTILAGLGPGESVVLAILFPLVVTGTFISSEIYKDAQEEAIKEGFGGGSLTETAIREETKLQSALAVHQKVVAYLAKPEAEQAIEAGAKSLLDDILSELRDTSQQMTRRALLMEEQDDRTRKVATTQRAGDPTSVVPTRAGNTTRQQSSDASVEQEFHEEARDADQHDNQHDTLLGKDSALLSERAQNARSFRDTTRSPAIRQGDQKEKRSGGPAAGGTVVAFTTGEG